MTWLMSEIHHIWQPLLLGSVLLGGIIAAAGYAATMLYWRIWVGRNWQKRKLRRRRQN